MTFDYFRNRQNYSCTTIPEFRGWDRKSPGSMDYSTALLKARANQKRQKSSGWRSLGNDDEFIAVSSPQQQPNQKKHKVAFVSINSKLIFNFSFRVEFE